MARRHLVPLRDASARQDSILPQPSRLVDVDTRDRLIVQVTAQPHGMSSARPTPDRQAHGERVGSRPSGRRSPVRPSMTVARCWTASPISARPARSLLCSTSLSVGDRRTARARSWARPPMMVSGALRSWCRCSTDAMGRPSWAPASGTMEEPFVDGKVVLRVALRKVQAALTAYASLIMSRITASMSSSWNGFPR